MTSQKLGTLVREALIGISALSQMPDLLTKLIEAISSSRLSSLSVSLDALVHQQKNKENAEYSIQFFNEFEKLASLYGNKDASGIQILFAEKKLYTYMGLLNSEGRNHATDTAKKFLNYYVTPALLKIAFYASEPNNTDLFITNYLTSHFSTKDELLQINIDSPNGLIGFIKLHYDLSTKLDEKNKFLSTYESEKERIIEIKETKKRETALEALQYRKQDAEDYLKTYDNRIKEALNGISMLYNRTPIALRTDVDAQLKKYDIKLEV